MVVVLDWWGDDGHWFGGFGEFSLVRFGLVLFT